MFDDELRLHNATLEDADKDADEEPDEKDDDEAQQFDTPSNNGEAPSDTLLLPAVPVTSCNESAASDDPSVLNPPPIAECTHIRYRDSSYEARKGLHGMWFAYNGVQLAQWWGHGTIDEARRSPNTVIKITPLGGSITVSNKKLKNELGLPVIQYTDAAMRLCAAHAAFFLVRALRPELRGAAGSSQAYFEKALPGTLDPRDDPTADDIRRVVAKHPFRVALVPVYNLSPHMLIQRGNDVLLVHIHATVKGASVRHFFVYVAATGCLLDPDAAGAEQVEDADRCLGAGLSKVARQKSNRKAMGVFYKAYPGADPGSITINRVWRGGCS